MAGKTVLAFAIVGGAFLLARRRGVVLNASPLFPASRNINDNVPTPRAQAAFWALQAGGPPSDMGSVGAGQVQPVGNGALTMFSGLFGRTRTYVPPAPGAGRGAPASPPGARSFGGSVFPPASPQPQSPVESTSPYTPTRLYLSAPLAANSWYYGLSGIDPRVAFAAGSGGYIAIVPPSSLREIV